MLTLTLGLGETVSADVRFLRGGRTLARKQYAKLQAGTRRPTVAIASEVAAGAAQLRVTLEDAAGDAKVIVRALRIPKR